MFGIVKFVKCHDSPHEFPDAPEPYGDTAVVVDVHAHCDSILILKYDPHGEDKVILNMATPYHGRTHHHFPVHLDRSAAVNEPVRFRI